MIEPEVMLLLCGFSLGVSTAIIVLFLARKI